MFQRQEKDYPVDETEENGVGEACWLEYLTEQIDSDKCFNLMMCCGNTWNVNGAVISVRKRHHLQR